MKLITNLLLIFTILVLTGCAGATSKMTKNEGEQIHWNPQQYAGLTHVVVGYNKDGTVKDVSWWDGKEKTDVTVEVVKNPDGTVTLNYSATGVTAFEGVGIRADVEKAIVEASKDVALGTIEGVIKAIKPPLNSGRASTTSPSVPTFCDLCKAFQISRQRVSSLSEVICYFSLTDRAHHVPVKVP